MIAKLIAWGRDRDEALARLRCALADTVVVIDGGTTNQGFLLELLDRPELRSGDVDTTWLDRLQLQGDIVAVRHADLAVVQAAVEISEAETADDRARFYAFARRGRPQADAGTARVVELRHRGQAYRCTVSQIAHERHRVTIDGVAVELGVRHVERLRATARARRRHLPHADLRAGRRPARRGRRRPPSHRPRRRRAGPQPRPGRRRVDPRRTRRRRGGRRRGRRRREHEDGDVARRTVPRPRPAGPGERERPRGGPRAAAAARAARRDGGRRGRGRADLVRGAAHQPARCARSTAARTSSGSNGPCSATTSAPPRSSGSSATCMASARTCSDAIPDSSRVSTACSRSTRTSRRSPRCVRTIPSPTASWGPARRSSCTPTCARSTRRPRASRRRTARLLRRALRHYGIESLDRTPALEEACYRLFLGQQRAGAVQGAVLAILDRRLEQVDTLAGVAGPDFRQALDRLAAATGGRDPVIADLARQVRFAYFDDPVIAAARAAVYAAADADLEALEQDPGAPIATRAWPPSSPARGRLPRRSHAGWRMRRRPLSACCWRRWRAGTTACARSSRSPRRPSTATASSPRATATKGRRGTSRPASWTWPSCPAALRAVAAWAAALPAGELAVADFYSRAEDAARPAELAERVRELLAGVALPPCMHRVVVAATAPGAGRALSAMTALTFRPGDGGLVEDAVLRGLHPMMSHRLQLARLSRVRARPAARCRGRLPVPRRRAREPQGRAAVRAGGGARPDAAARRRRAGRRAARARADDRDGARGNPPLPGPPQAEPPAPVEPHPPARLADDRPDAGGDPRDRRPHGAVDGRPGRRDGAHPRPAARGRRHRARSRAAPVRPGGAAAWWWRSTPRRASRCSRWTRERCGSSPRGAAGCCTRPRSSSCSRPAGDERAAPGQPAGAFVEHDLDEPMTAAGAGRPPAGDQPGRDRRRAAAQLHRAPPRGHDAGDADGRPHARARRAGRAGVPPDHGRARPRRGARRAARVVRPLLRRAHRDGQRHREHGLDRGRAAADRRVHAGGRRDQRRRGRHQRRRPAVLERRGDDADAHARHPRHDARQRDGADRQAVAGLFGRRLGRGQLRHRRL